MDYTHCTLCPRRCGVNRAAGELGYCRMPGQVMAAKAVLFPWEEPVITGESGTGAVFFSGCTLNCAFCQNEEISHEGEGKPLTVQQLQEIYYRLIAQGAQTISLITPTQFLPDIRASLSPRLLVPVVYNCGGYERMDTLRHLEGWVDVYLPDMKYSDPALAARLSGAADYVEQAKESILEMYRQTGPYVVVNGIMRRGVLVRHLVLPGQVDNSIGVLTWLAQAFPRHSIMVSLMSQYVPMGRAKAMPPFHRRVTAEEYDVVVSWLRLLGLDDGYIQDPASAQTYYRPNFDGAGLNTISKSLI